WGWRRSRNRPAAAPGSIPFFCGTFSTVRLVSKEPFTSGRPVVRPSSFVAEMVQETMSLPAEYPRVITPHEAQGLRYGRTAQRNGHVPVHRYRGQYSALGAAPPRHGGRSG